MTLHSGNLHPQPWSSWVAPFLNHQTLGGLCIRMQGPALVSCNILMLRYKARMLLSPEVQNSQRVGAAEPLPTLTLESMSVSVQIKTNHTSPFTEPKKMKHKSTLVFLAASPANMEEGENHSSPTPYSALQVPNMASATSSSRGSSAINFQCCLLSGDVRRVSSLSATAVPWAFVLGQAPIRLLREQL